ncbi:hypothetical protein [Rathayibacter sp. Leaf248]|jgi:hypothetical protein|uniref:hypothetical protein n=1 Tax=Rathayibacter sp. Leaf248 TaxID=2876555 RepID=UPI001E2DE6D3|nr:hypothetical protein [Rathayibacter sp. Leaf248]
MTSNLRFEQAVQEWLTEPVVQRGESRALHDLSATLLDLQTRIEPVLRRTTDLGEASGVIDSAHWQTGVDWMLQRSIRDIRWLRQTGRHQEATASLLSQAETLKRAWSAYKALPQG